MYNKILYENEFISLAIEDSLAFVKIKEPGYDINDFKQVTASCPRLKLTKFVALKTAIENKMNAYVEIGEFADIVGISVSKDKFTAYGTILLTEEEFEEMDKDVLREMILKRAEKENISYGLDVVFVMGNMRPLKPFEIAKGLLPIDGEDAIISLYKIDDLKPELIEDGTINHYELNLINKVNQGDWLGERIEPTEGRPGRTVFGDVVNARKGAQEKLIYDRKTVHEKLCDDGTKTFLRARRTGAVVYVKGVISVCNYLEINGKVSFETGNIDFDGYVDVKDTVEDNFSVVADEDIQILGTLGLGGVNLIKSREGNIYIRGGIAGQDKAEIVCKGDLYTKFAADCKIICEGSIHVGYYLMNVDVVAKEVLMESMNSRIIGGKIQADIRVEAGEIGSKAEVLTEICVKGFSREGISSEYETLGLTIEKLRDMSKLLKEKINNLEELGEELSSDQKYQLRKYDSDYDKTQKSLKAYEQKRKNFISYLHARGEGEIKATKRMYPNVSLTLGTETTLNLEDKKVGVSYYLQNDEMISD